MNLKNILYYTSIALVVFTVTYLGQVAGIIQLTIAIFLYGSIFYLFHILWVSVRKKEKEKYLNYIVLFTKKISLGFVLIGLILYSFAYYQNEINPAKMPEYTISNGEKTVIFQGMSHIGSEDFYLTIRDNLSSAKREGYVYFFEGVKPGSKESSEKFDKALGIKFDKGLYENFSKIYGVQHQDNSIYYNLENDLDFNVDVDLDYIVSEYEKKIESGENNTGMIGSEDEPIDISKEINKTVESLNDKQLKVLVYINQSILNFIIKSDGTKDLIQNNFSNKTLFDIILYGRNDVLAKEIIESEYDKIYVTYGLLHFNGVLELLKQNDSNWKIINENYLIPIK